MVKVKSIQKKAEWTMFVTVVSLVIPILTWYITSENEKHRQATEDHARELSTVMQLVDYLTSDSDRRRAWAISYLRAGHISDKYMPQLIAAAGDDDNVLDTLVEGTRTADSMDIQQQSIISMPMEVEVSGNKRVPASIVEAPEAPVAVSDHIGVPEALEPEKASVAASMEAYFDDSDLLDSIADQLAQMIPGLTPKGNYVVYIHIDNKKDQRLAERLEAQLQRQGVFSVKGIEFVKEVSRTQVRFFHPEDAKAARDLALQSLKLLGRKVSVLDLSKSKYRTLVDPGHLEIWI